MIYKPHGVFGRPSELSERSIVPGDTAELGETRFEDSLSLSANHAPAAPAQPANAASMNPLVLKENEFRASELSAGSALLWVYHGFRGR